MNKTYTVFIVASNAEGAPEILAYDLECNEDQYAEGWHCDQAKLLAENDGYDVITAFDHKDMAGQQLLQLHPLYGDAERTISEINQTIISNSNQCLDEDIILVSGYYKDGLAFDNYKAVIIDGDSSEIELENDESIFFYFSRGEKIIGDIGDFVITCYVDSKGVCHTSNDMATNNSVEEA